MINKKKDDRTYCEKDAEERERHNRELGVGFHPLQHRFVYLYLRRQPGVRSQASYEENMKKTVEDFWVFYCHFAQVSSMPNPTNLHFFKEGIQPLWEDPRNHNGSG
jgi:translation initiation factor 4E